MGVNARIGFSTLFFNLAYGEQRNSAEVADPIARTCHEFLPISQGTISDQIRTRERMCAILKDRLSSPRRDYLDGLIDRLFCDRRYNGSTPMQPEATRFSAGARHAVVLQEAGEPHWRHQVFHMPLQSHESGSITCIALPGRKGGRPKALTPKKARMVQDLYRNKENSIDEICKTLNISRTTLYRYIKTKAHKLHV
jgi:hypothetical protein